MQIMIKLSWTDLGEVKSLILNELGTLPDLPTSTSKKTNKQFKKSQPLWNQNLESAWKDVCKAE